MKINTIMPSNLIPFYKKELEAVKDNLQADNLNMAWYHDKGNKFKELQMLQ